MINRTLLVYLLLGAALLLIVGWQAVEHNRVREASRSALIYRARDITSTLGLVIRSQRWRGGLVFQQRLESALNELAKNEALQSIACVNVFGEVVASAGKPIDDRIYAMLPQGERWDRSTLTIVNPVVLGDAETGDNEGSRPTIVLPPRPENPGEGREESGRPRPPRRNDGPTSTNAEPARSGEPPGRPEHSGGRRREGDSWRFGRPPWMSEEEWKTMVDNRGLHGFVIVLPTDSYRSAATQDLWLRAIIGSFATCSVLGLGLAWRNLERSSELQMRLLRASEMNTHLKEMNVAAAGLAHETRNPLNIIRGLAQMISKEEDASAGTKKKSLEIAEEVDRVSAQLNEFINYSKPREVRRAAVVLSSVVRDVVRALKTDMEDKSIRLNLVEEDLVVEADERLLRQVLFNLLMNAIQAVEAKGEIEIALHKSSPEEGWFEVRDTGPGVPAEHRKDIFRPYFTTRPAGTGLGLAVVQQIVLAHGWDVDCLPNHPRGALFRVSRLRRMAKA